MNFNGKNILITGASSGIGKELAKQFSKFSCTLHLVARRLYILTELKKDIETNNNRIFIYKGDISDKQDVVSTFKQISSTADKIDLAILNAGVSHRSDIIRFDSDKAKNIFDTNVMGIIYCVEQLLPQMIKNKAGLIVGVSSLADSRGFSKSSVYCASKAAATRFLEGLRIELYEFGIKVLTVKPGFVKTAMTDKNNFKMPFLMDVNKAAKIIIEGIEKEKKIIQFPFLTVIGSKLIGVLPVGIYDFFSKFADVK